MSDARRTRKRGTTATSKELARSTRSRGGLVWLERAVEEMPTGAGGGGRDGRDACAERCHCRVAPDPEGEHPVKHWSVEVSDRGPRREKGEREEEIGIGIENRRGRGEEAGRLRVAVNAFAVV